MTDVLPADFRAQSGACRSPGRLVQWIHATWPGGRCHLLWLKCRGKDPRLVPPLAGGRLRSPCQRLFRSLWDKGASSQGVAETHSLELVLFYTLVPLPLWEPPHGLAGMGDGESETDCQLPWLICISASFFLVPDSAGFPLRDGSQRLFTGCSSTLSHALPSLGLEFRSVPSHLGKGPLSDCTSQASTGQHQQVELLGRRS